MYYHKEKKVVYHAHMKVASRDTRDALQRRGFLQAYGHHGGPHGGRSVEARDRLEAWAGHVTWWFDQDPGDFTFYGTVRNHFDIVLTFLHWGVDGMNAITHECLAKFMWGRTSHFHNGHRLFRGLSEIPDMRIIRYESLRLDVSDMLYAHGLPPLEDGELANDGRFATVGKPREDYRTIYTPEERLVVEERYAGEMAQLGYSWDGLTIPRPTW